MRVSSRRDSQPRYEMAHFDPENTGLDTRIWISVKGHARHGPRPKVVTEDKKLLSVSLALVPTVVATPARYRLAAASLHKVEAFIVLNLDTLLAYWYEAITTPALVQLLRRVEGARHG